MADDNQPGFVPVYEPGSGKLLLRVDVRRDQDFVSWRFLFSEDQ